MGEHDSLATILPPDLLARVKALAERTDRPIEACVRQAVQDYCETWEAYHETVDGILSDRDKPRSLRIVNE
ncbi:ribbon-helix-helix protein, CopG family [Roseospira navarrensis]|uniref:Ribbon-helix-helix protein, CopG family n=1 Tax=Roseospira navarrensis TaxID=140058 RepID=A0A7X1ZDL3_9PROT|nr:ribbon-helix-helix protein, CopG family [Roseospira navarrensis]MQX36598.1 ribbon-helix-helix protein, CopG family [Roseospira navarrensis]